MLIFLKILIWITTTIIAYDATLFSLRSFFSFVLGWYKGLEIRLTLFHRFLKLSPTSALLLELEMDHSKLKINYILGLLYWTFSTLWNDLNEIGTGSSGPLTVDTLIIFGLFIKLRVWFVLLFLPYSMPFCINLILLITYLIGPGADVNDMNWELSISGLLLSADVTLSTKPLMRSTLLCLAFLNQFSKFIGSGLNDLKAVVKNHKNNN